MADGPGGAPSDRPWRVLLGFVQWNKDIKKFKSVGLESEGIRPPYAGVKADIVAARGGSLTLRSRAVNEPGKPGLHLNETGGGLLEFGMLTAQGRVTPVFSVNAKGDITAAGKISGAVTPGSVHVQSGTAMDGIILPLPPGITQEMIDAGKVVAHVHIAPRVPASAPPNSTDEWAACSHECSVDNERRVRCRVRWLRLVAGAVAGSADVVGQCTYLVAVSVPAN